jgi:hypothetical protein
MRKGLMVIPSLQAAGTSVLLRAAEGLDHAVDLVEVQHVDVDAAADSGVSR